MTIWGVHITHLSGAGSRWFDSYWVAEEAATKREQQLDAMFKCHDVNARTKRVRLELEDGKAVTEDVAKPG